MPTQSTPTSTSGSSAYRSIMRGSMLRRTHRSAATSSPSTSTLIRSAGIDGRSSSRPSTMSRRTAGSSGWRNSTRSSPGLLGGWTWRARCDEQVREFVAHPKFVGVRHVTQDEPDDDFIVREKVLRGLAVLEKHQVPFDLLFYVKHLHHVPALARRLPDLPMVIDHLAKPRIKEHVTEDWLPHLRAAASFPNVFCKLSGMITEADWQTWTAERSCARTSRPPSKRSAPIASMFGSDWPVSRACGDVLTGRRRIGRSAWTVDRAGVEKIFSGTAIRFYKLVERNDLHRSNTAIESDTI